MRRYRDVAVPPVDGHAAGGHVAHSTCSIQSLLTSGSNVRAAWPCLISRPICSAAGSGPSGAAGASVMRGSPYRNSTWSPTSSIAVTSRHSASTGGPSSVRASFNEYSSRCNESSTNAETSSSRSRRYRWRVLPPTSAAISASVASRRRDSKWATALRIARRVRARAPVSRGALDMSSP